MTSLDSAAVGTAAEVVAIRLPAPARDFLEGVGISVGVRLVVLAAGEPGMLVDAPSGPVNLVRRLAAGIDVSRVS